MESSNVWEDEDVVFSEELLKDLEAIEQQFYSSEGSTSNGGLSKSSEQDKGEVAPVLSCSPHSVEIDRCLMKTNDGKRNYEHLLLDWEDDNSIDDPDFVLQSDESDSSEYSTTGNKGRPTSVLKKTICPKNALREIQNKSIVDRGEIPSTSAEKTPNKSNEEIITQIDEENCNENVRLLVKPKRKRQKRRNSENWADNQRKKQRNSGLEYTSRTGKKVQERRLRVPCNVQTCLYDCKKFTENDRSHIFSEFWKLGELRMQREYVVRRVTVEQVKRTRTENSKRKQTNLYTLKKGETEFRVCKKFFLSTLDVSEKMVRTTLSQYTHSVSGVLKAEGRGKQTPTSKYSEETINLMLEHINSFPRVPAHWCRKDSAKDYLESILNKERMYSLYIEFCREKNVTPVCKTTYKEMLLKLNIGFHVPKKDQCWCYDFESLPLIEKESRQAEYDIHIKRKQAAKEEKANDAKIAASDPSFLSANFDLEAVLYCPLKYAKPVFYKRKLACYNFTVYTVGPKEGFCYFWDETTGNRGSLEVASCLFKFISNIESPITQLSLFSDCCPGQNRNSIVVTMLSHALSVHPSLKVINLKFLEPGHTHMECDSMHATIETASQCATVYCPRDWLNVIKLAKKNGKPYQVKVMNIEDFWDFKNLKKSKFLNTTVAMDGSKLAWGSVKWIRLVKEKPDSLFYKNEFWDSDFKELNVTGKREVSSEEGNLPRKRRKSKGNQSDTTPLETTHQQNHTLKPAYSKRLSLGEAKIKDLKEMCRTGVIPQEYHCYYKELETIAANSPRCKSKQIQSQKDKEDDMTLAEMRRVLKKRRPKKK